MPVDGSAEPRRLTYASTDDTPVDFPPAGEEVLFASRRDEAIRWMPALYMVPTTGGTPALAQAALGQRATFSPDGSALAFVRGSTDWTRRGYRGSANRELWLQDRRRRVLPARRLRRRRRRPGVGRRGPWCSCPPATAARTSYRLNLATPGGAPADRPRRLDVRSPRLSADGQPGGLRVRGRDLDPAHRGRRAAEAARSRCPPTRWRIHPPGAEDATGRASSAGQRRDGELVAFVVGGDVFVTAITPQGGPGDRAAADGPGHRHPRAGAGPRPGRRTARALLFASARGGNLDLYLARPADPGNAWTETFAFPVERADLARRRTSAPPGSRPTAAARVSSAARGTWSSPTADGSGEPVLLRHWEAPEFDWSPDGKFLAYSHAGRWTTTPRSSSLPLGRRRRPTTSAATPTTTSSRAGRRTAAG